MSKIAFAGDWHGDTEFAAEIIKKVSQKGIHEIQHVGDFGLFFKDNYIHEISKISQKYNVTVEITPGNHEDWNKINSLIGINKHIVPIDKFEKIFIHPRGDYWKRYGVSFVSFGGAPSIDFKWRTKNVDWFQKELITYEDLDYAKTLPKADILITHDVSLERVPEIQAHTDRNPLGFDNESRQYANIGQSSMELLYTHFEPKFWFHGHYHFDTITKNRMGEIWSLNMNNNQHNVAIFDTETKKVSWL